MTDPTTCPELNEIRQALMNEEYVCVECIKTGDEWMHLRTCQTCGESRCCDQSKNKHATRHYHRSGHPVAASAEPGERWLWCYKHGQFSEW